MKRGSNLAIAAMAGAALLWAVWTAYEDYWLPVRDLRAMGVDWIQPWTPRRVDRYRWRDGSQVVYTFGISAELEQALRARCIRETGTSQRGQLGTCYIAVKRSIDRPTIELELQRGLIKLYYTG